MTEHGIEIEAVTAPTEEVRVLVEELEAELAALYSAEQRHGLALDAIFQPHIRFFVARCDGAAAGCGGVAFFRDFAEVKRMYVRKELRGLGIAPAILARLEAETRARGLRLLRLETGTESFAAQRFYARMGFHECDAFEPYAAMAPHNVSASAFYEKTL